MIPKTIHYIWLSGEELPPLNQACIDSWGRALKGYDIKCWRRDDFDLESIPYVSEAVKARKWAFATDCLRTQILFREGGIYLDSDVYMFGNFDNCLDNRFFSCIEFHWDSKSPAIQAACMGSEPGHPFMKECTDFYFGRHFLHQNGEPLAPDIFSKIAEGYGFDAGNKGEQIISEGIHIYDSTLVAGTPWEMQESNTAVHLCDGSWREMEEIERLRISRYKLAMVLQKLKSH